MTSASDIKAHKAAGSWRVLERLAVELKHDAAQKAQAEFRPVLGGGTRLMLTLEHRISDDIGLFLNNPQWIGYLTPRLNDRMDPILSGYDEGATSLKLRFKEGEIDFIVAMSLLGLPNEVSSECAFELEPVAEVLAKKLFYRGWALTPRDLFDWRMLEENLPADAVQAPLIASLIKHRIDKIQAALSALVVSKQSQAIWGSIRSPHALDFRESIAWAQSRLLEYQQMTLAPGEQSSEQPGLSRFAPR